MTLVCDVPQLESVMAIPSVDYISHNGMLYMFNGWIGEHDVTHNTLFEFEDALSNTIWVDQNGRFVCEK